MGNGPVIDGGKIKNTLIAQNLVLRFQLLKIGNRCRVVGCVVDNDNLVVHPLDRADKALHTLPNQFPMVFGGNNDGNLLPTFQPITHIKIVKQQAVVHLPSFATPCKVAFQHLAGRIHHHRLAQMPGRQFALTPKVQNLRDVNNLPGVLCRAQYQVIVLRDRQCCIQSANLSEEFRSKGNQVHDIGARAQIFQRKCWPMRVVDYLFPVLRQGGFIRVNHVRISTLNSLGNPE